MSDPANAKETPNMWERYTALERENAALRSELEAAERKLIGTGIWREAPCCICGYNGPGYFQPSKHSCAAIDVAIAQGKGEK